MITVDVSGDIRDIERHLSQIHQQKIPRAAASAMNRAIDAATTAAAREVSRATKIPVSTVRDKLLKRRASQSHLIAELRALPYAPNLSRHGRPTLNKTGTAASAWEKRKTYRHAFIDPKTGRVVTRTTNKRFPWKGLRGPSVRKTFMRARIQAKIDAVAAQAWRSRFDHELARLLRR